MTIVEMTDKETIEILEEIIADYLGWDDIDENDIYIKALRHAIDRIKCLRRLV